MNNGTIDVGTALKYAWNRFRANPVPWIVVTLPLLLVAYFQAVTSIEGGPISSSVGLTITMSIVTFVLGLFYRIVVARGALLEVDGRKPALGDFFSVSNWGQALLTALLVALLSNLPAWILPSVAGWFVVYGSGGGALGFVAVLLAFLTLALTLSIVFFTWFAVIYTVDQALPPVESLKASFAVIRSNFSPLFALALSNAGIVFAGALLCGLGLPIAIPLVMISSVYAYRVLVSGPVAPLDPNRPPPGGYYQPGGFTEPPYPPQA